MRIQLNGEALEIEDDATVCAVLAHVDLLQQHVAVEVNLDVVPREQHATLVLKDGDQIEVVTLVGGG